MIVDYLRSCYTTEVKFFRDSNTTHKIRWFWCDKDAKPLPYYTRFASANWGSDKFRDWPGVGEVKGALRQWDDGFNASGLTGQKPCGSESQFGNGLVDGEQVVHEGDCCELNPRLLIGVEIYMDVEPF